MSAFMLVDLQPRFLRFEEVLLQRIRERCCNMASESLEDSLPRIRASVMIPPPLIDRTLFSVFTGVWGVGFEVPYAAQFKLKMVLLGGITG